VSDTIKVTDVMKFYDNIAQNYDEQLRNCLLEGIIRKNFHNKLIFYFKQGDRVLELGCGTGTDAIYLAKHGVFLTSTDISGKMIEAANEKIKKENINSNIEILVLDAQKFTSQMNKSYKGIFSNFDALNYIDIRLFSKDLANFMQDGTFLLFTILNKRCFWEFLYYLIKLKPIIAFNNLIKRNRNYAVEMTLYSPSEIKKIFSKYFIIKKITGFGFLIPPDGFRGLQHKFHWIFTKIEKLDIFLASIFPLRNFCDHYIIEMERNEKEYKNT
jgi:ubiquinone/menaquinone biosynthesis C-methylase UbiE